MHVLRSETFGRQQSLTGNPTTRVRTTHFDHLLIVSGRVTRTMNVINNHHDPIEAVSRRSLRFLVVNARLRLPMMVRIELGMESRFVWNVE